MASSYISHHLAGIRPHTPAHRVSLKKKRVSHHTAPGKKKSQVTLSARGNGRERGWGCGGCLGNRPEDDVNRNYSLLASSATGLPLMYDLGGEALDCSTCRRGVGWGLSWWCLLVCSATGLPLMYDLGGEALDCSTCRRTSVSRLNTRSACEQTEEMQMKVYSEPTTAPTGLTQRYWAYRDEIGTVCSHW